MQQWLLPKLLPLCCDALIATNASHFFIVKKTSHYHKVLVVAVAHLVVIHVVLVDAILMLSLPNCCPMLLTTMLCSGSPQLISVCHLSLFVVVGFQLSVAIGVVAHHCC